MIQRPIDWLHMDICARFPLVLGGKLINGSAGAVCVCAQGRSGIQLLIRWLMWDPKWQGMISLCFIFRHAWLVSAEPYAYKQKHPINPACSKALIELSSAGKTYYIRFCVRSNTSCAVLSAKDLSFFSFFSFFSLCCLNAICSPPGEQCSGMISTILTFKMEINSWLRAFMDTQKYRLWLLFTSGQFFS